MRQFLKRLKLIDHLTITLDTNKSEFILKLEKIVDKSDFGYFDGFFDSFSKKNEEYKGLVHSKGFILKKRNRLFESNINLAVAEGTFEESSDNLKIKTEIKGLNIFFIFYYIFLTIIYGGFMTSALFGYTENLELIFIPFIIFHALLMFSIPYFVMKRNVQNLKYILEREFFFISKS